MSPQTEQTQGRDLFRWDPLLAKMGQDDRPEGEREVNQGVTNIHQDALRRAGLDKGYVLPVSILPRTSQREPARSTDAEWDFRKNKNWNYKD